MPHSLQVMGSLRRLVELQVIFSGTSLHKRSRACTQLKSKIARKLVAKEQLARRRNLARHVPDAAAAVFRVLTAMAADGDGARPPGPKRRGEARVPAALGACVQQLVGMSVTADVRLYRSSVRITEFGLHAQQLAGLFRRPACARAFCRLKIIVVQRL